MTLRRRVVLALAALAVLALASTLVSTAVIRGALLGRIDDTLVNSPIRGELPAAVLVRSDPCEVPQVADALVVVAGPDGTVRLNCGSVEAPSIDFAAFGLESGGISDPFTIRAGSEQYRMIVREVSIGGGGYIGFGLSLADTNATIRRVAGIQLAAVLLILGGFALVARWLLRRGLAPLGEIARTADAIAAGNRNERVDIAGHPRDEAGRVGSALNQMLDELDRNFEEVSAARDQTARAELRIRQFVQDASHELKTPLTSISGYTELYRRGALPTPEAVDDAMGRIDAESQRVTRLVHDMLRLARLDTEPQLVIGAHDIVPIVRAAAQDATVIDASWPVEVLAPDRPVIVAMDPEAIHQVLANVLANVRVHTPPGTRTTMTVDQRADDVLVAIADDGPGIPAAVLPEVFERFVRADPSRQRAKGGSGLGLAVVRSIVTAHGGTITAATREPHGAVFEVTLPRR